MVEANFIGLRTAPLASASAYSHAHRSGPGWPPGGGDPVPTPGVTGGTLGTHLGAQPSLGPAMGLGV